MYASEIIWGRSEIFGRRRREGWLGFTVLLENFLSLACSDIALNRRPFTIKEPFWVCKLTTKDKAATWMTKYEWTLSCIAITQPCLWLWERSQAGSVSATQWSQKPKKYADVSAHLEESVLWLPKKLAKNWSADFQSSRNFMWHTTRRKATVSTGPHLMNSASMTRMCSSRHMHVSFIHSKPWHPIVRLFSKINVQDISA